MDEKAIFYDAELENKFSEFGYVKIPFLDQAAVTALLDFHQLNTPDNDAKFYMSIWNPDLKKRRQIHEYIVSIFDKVMTKHIRGFRYMISSFAIKKPDPESSWFIHQDYSFVDEKKHRSFSIWCPLTDVDQYNGALQVIDRSHLAFEGPRGQNTKNIFEDIDEYLRDNFLKTIEMKAGEALLFDHRLIHASGANNSPEDRIAAVAVLIPQDADVIFYHKDNEVSDPRIEILKLAPNYYVDCPLVDKPGIRPQGEGVFSIGFIPDHTKILSKQMFDQSMSILGNPDRNLLQRLYKIFIH